MKRRKRCCINTILSITGTILISAAIVLFVCFDSFFDVSVKSALKFDETSKAYKAWRKNDPPIPMDLYLFNWTNPEDIRNPNIKPKFQEVGPYKFREAKEKVNITWHSNHTISYRHVKYYFADSDMPESKLDEVINILNPVPLSLAYQNRFSSFFTKRSFSFSLNALSQMYVTKSVREILFEGYDENILSIASSLPFTGVQDKFGLFYGKNATVDYNNWYSMWTDNDDKFGRLMSFNFRNHTDYYPGKCSQIEGSAGEFHPMNRDRDYITIYSAELCKYANLEYETDVEVKGVKGYKYGSKYLFDNGTERAENACFCQGECIPSGALNVSTCRLDSPIFLSLPHFYHADRYYTDAIEGMHPDKDKHDFFMSLEPKTAIAFDVAARMQLNMLLQPLDHFEMYKDVPRVFIPIFYFDQRLPPSDELAANLRLIQNMPQYSTIASVILVVLGSLCLLWVFFSMLCFANNKFRYPEDCKIPQNNHEQVPLN